MILFQRLGECAQNLPLMFRIDHINEIKNNNSTKIAHTQLSSDGGGGFEIGLEHSLRVILAAEIGAGIYVHRRHRFSLIDDEITTGLEFDLASQRLVDLVINPVQIEHRPLTGI